MMNEKINAMKLNDAELEMICGGHDSKFTGPWTKIKIAGGKIGGFFVDFIRLIY